MAFPDSFVEEVRRTADIVRVISEHVQLRKMGTSWKGRCPFHQEKTPSFNVRQEPAVFHCFGCGVGGDVFKFVMLHERASFPEAVESIARRFGIPVPENRYEQGSDRKEREELLAVMEAAAQHFSRALWTPAGTAAREYLLGRGFTRETLERIRAGAARDAWDDLLNALRPQFPVPLLLKAGLVLEKPEAGRVYDRFRNRAVFPILNESGKVVAFGARSLDGSEPKYLNSPETPVYQKGRTLYALNWAKDAARHDGRIVLMEGYLDVARALQAGIGEAVATCGTALTAGHARLLHRFAERVVVNFDQDAAGQKAARKSFEILAEEGMSVHVVELPEGHDPDTYLRDFGADSYRERLAGAPHFVDWLIRRAAVENDVRTPPGKAAYLAALLPTLVRIDNAVERAAWLPRVVERGGLDPQAAADELRRALGGRPAPSGPAPVERRVPVAAPAALLAAEKGLLRAVLKEAQNLDQAFEELHESDFERLASAEALRAAKALYLRGEALTGQALLAQVANDETRRMLTELAVQEQPESAQGPVECVMELRHVRLRQRLAEIQKGLSGATGPELESLLVEKNEVVRLIANL